MLWLGAGVAFADVYLVRDVRVEASAATSKEARAIAFQEAKVIAANRMIARLTLPADRNAAEGLRITGETASRLAAAVDVQDEKQTGQKYYGLLAVKFDPSAVQAFLNVYKVPYVTATDAFAMIAPATDGATVDPFAWAAVWSETKDDTLLTPYAGASVAYPDGASWQELSAEAARLRARRAVIARASLTNGQVYVKLTDIRPDADLPQVLGTIGPYASLEEARDNVGAFLERDWKNRTIVRAVGATNMTAIAKFNSLRSWATIERALSKSRMIRDLDVTALSTSGADLQFVFLGRADQFSTELRASGVQLTPDGASWILETVSR